MPLDRQLPVLILALSLARSRPQQVPVTCEVDLAAEDPAYLLPPPQALECGFPSGRSYLLAKFGLALVPDAAVRDGAPLSALAAGRENSLRVRGCRAVGGGGGAAWGVDDLRFATREPGWCEPAALDVWARLVGPAIVRLNASPARESAAPGGAVDDHTAAVTSVVDQATVVVTLTSRRDVVVVAVGGPLLVEDGGGVSSVALSLASLRSTAPVRRWWRPPSF